MGKINWTPENDRLLLLKLVETHGIKVDTNLIVKAWPGPDADKPTARAITERFVKLRQIAGIKASIKSTPNKARARPIKDPKTPGSSAKKRKPKKIDEYESESEGDGHMTPSEDETPTKTRKTMSARAPRTGGRGFHTTPSNDFDGNLDGMDKGSPRNVRVKTEVADDPFNSGEFDRDFARATELQRVNNGPQLGNSFGGSYDYSMPPTPGSSGHDSLDDSNLHISLYGSFGDGMNSGIGMSGNMDTNMPIRMNAMNDYGIPVDTLGFNSNQLGSMQHLTEPFITNTSRLQLSPNQKPYFAAPSPRPSNPRSPIMTKKNPPPMRASVAPSETSTGGGYAQDLRPRSSREASRQASRGVAAFIQEQVEKDREDGEAPSEEDSQASEFQGSDDDLI